MIASQADELPVKLMCQAAEASRSGYYAWKTRPESRRAQENRRLLFEIETVHAESRETYGSRRIHAEVRARGFTCDRHRVERLMRENGIRGVQKPGRKSNPEDKPHEESVVPDRLRRNFAVALPNRVWLGDITQMMSGQGVVYFGLLMDMCSRLIVGWAAGPRKDRRLTISALETALGWRKPPAALIHHTDRGGQYACPDYTAVLEKHGALASMSRPGTPHDNAPMESFIKTLKVEFINRHRFETREEAIAAVGEHIQMFYNCRRRHSALGYLSPAEYERQLVKPS